MIYRMSYKSHEHGKTGLHWAAETDQVETARLLLDAGDDIEAKTAWGATPLDWPRNGHTAVVEYLLDKGALVDAKSVFGGTALHWAAINGHRDTVELLIARGASLNIHDARFDSTPEGWANEGGHTGLADLLRTRS